MSTAPAPAQKEQAPAAEAKQEIVKAFFNSDPKGPVVNFFVDPKNPNFEPGRPAMFGNIGEDKVTVFVEPAGTAKESGKEYGAFMSINKNGGAVDGKPGEFHPSEKLATANFVVTKGGKAALAINPTEGETIWATPRKELSDDQRVAAGLNLEKLKEVKEAIQTAKATSPEVSSDAEAKQSNKPRP